MKKDVYRKIDYQKIGLVVLSVFIFLLIFLLLPHQVFAKEDNFYYTYGGFNAVVDAWKRLGLFFSNNKFISLFAGAIILGIIILYFMVLAKATLAGSARFNLASWGIPVLLGIAVYVAFLSPAAPKDQIVVYDTVLNKVSEPISNIPKIIAMPAKVLSEIENGMIEIVKTSSSLVDNYEKNAGGTGFTILSQFGDPMTITMAGLPIGVQQTAYQFIKDCLIFELARNGTDLTAQDISSGKVDFKTAIQKAKNPGVPTIYYDDQTGEEKDTINGVEVTCESAGEILLSYIDFYINDDINRNKIAKATCALSGFNIDVPQELQACRDLVESTFNHGIANATGGGSNLKILSYQAFFAQALISALNTLNPESSIKLMATKEAASQYLGLAIHANTWLPVIRETLRAVAIAISPIVLLFAATPLVGRAIGFILGMMIWVTTWSVIDAILHSAAVAQAKAASTEFSQAIINGTPGTMFFVLLPSYSSKVAAVFGAIRWSGLGLATVLTGMLIKFGGAALAMVAGSITGAAQSAGAAMGRMVADVTSPIRADLVPTASWTNAAFEAGGVAALSRGLTEFQSGSLLGQARAGSYLGAGQIAQSTFLSNIETVARNLALGSAETAWEVGETGGLQAKGGARGLRDLARQFRKTVDYMAWAGVLGYRYQNNLLEGPTLTLMRGPNGWIPIATKVDLFKSALKELNTKSREKLYAKMREALDSMSYEEAKQFYEENKHMFSAGLRAKFEAFLNDLKERGVKRDNQSSSQDGYENYDENHVNIAATGSLGGGYNRLTTLQERGTAPGSGGGPLIPTKEQLFSSPSSASVSGGWGASAGERNTTGYSNKDTVHQTKGTDIKNAVAMGLADEIANMDSHTVGSVLQKLFKDQHTYQEAAKAVDQYKEAQTLESSMTVNTWLALVKEIGDKYYSYLPEEGPNSRYEVAQQVMTQDFYAGRNIELYKQELENITKRMQGQHIVEGPQGNDLITSVKNKLNEQPQFIKAKEAQIPMFPFNRNFQADINAVQDFVKKYLYLDPSLQEVAARMGVNFEQLGKAMLYSPSYTTSFSKQTKQPGGRPVKR